MTHSERVVAAAAVVVVTPRPERLAVPAVEAVALRPAPVTMVAAVAEAP